MNKIELNLKDTLVSINTISRGLYLVNDWIKVFNLYKSLSLNSGFLLNLFQVNWTSRNIKPNVDLKFTHVYLFT